MKKDSAVVFSLSFREMDAACRKKDSRGRELNVFECAENLLAGIELYWESLKGS